MSEGEKFIWCLVANVPGSNREPDNSVADEGTKHFAPGTKVFCFPHPSGGKAGRIRVIGHHRGGGSRLVEMMISVKHLVNWRSQKTFRPDVISRMIDAWDDSESSRIITEQMAEFYGSTVPKV